MHSLVLTERQEEILDRPGSVKVFLEGPAGCGKTTVGAARLKRWTEQGVQAHSILVLLPHRALDQPYRSVIEHPDMPAGSSTTILTMGGLARRMVELFWPLIAEKAGFQHPSDPPKFLTLETAQYVMARVVQPMLDIGSFETITIHPHRLYSQILDDLNKAAVVGFPHTEIGDRLKRAWIGDASQLKVYEEAQSAALQFREICLESNLLDFSLQMEVFLDHIWPEPFFHEYFHGRYRYLIADNIEEDTPVAHDVTRGWLEELESALLIYDQRAGFRRFLGADPEHASSLRSSCDECFELSESFVTSTKIASFGVRFSEAIAGDPIQEMEILSPDINFNVHSYHPEMLDWVVDEVERLLHVDRVRPGDIVVLAPFLTEQLRFSLEDRFKAKEIMTWSRRPSRALREEQTVRTMLTMAHLCHPAWGIQPSVHDVVRMLMSAIEGMDLVRAHLLANILYRARGGEPTLESFEQIQPEMQKRITFRLGNKFERLRRWLEAEQMVGGARTGRDHELALDVFLSRLFGEILAQPGYGFHRDFDAGAAAERLILSVRTFRQTLGERVSDDHKTVGEQYAQMVQEGVLPSLYLSAWEEVPEAALLMAPAYTFLMANRAVDVQIWLDVGNPGWWERLYQPLTHPYVLSRQWPTHAQWSDNDEVRARDQALQTLVLGLLRRCRSKVYFSMSELSVQGDEQRGPLLEALNQILRLQAPRTPS